MAIPIDQPFIVHEVEMLYVDQNNAISFETPIPTINSIIPYDGTQSFSVLSTAKGSPRVGASLRWKSIFRSILKSLSLQEVYLILEVNCIYTIGTLMQP